MDWNSARKDPCLLLTVATVREATGVQDPQKVDAPAGSCRYNLGRGRQAVLDLYQPLTKQAIADRTAGTTAASVDGAELLQLDTPGVGLLVHHGRTAALVAIRTADVASAADVASQVTAMASPAVGLLPKAPAVSDVLIKRDPCEVVPASLFRSKPNAGDGQAPGACAYRFSDGTQLLIRFLPDATPGGAGPAEPWPEGGPGARWQGTKAGKGGSGLGVLSLSQGTAEISVSSSVRSVAEQKKIATVAAAATSAADGG